MTYLSAADLSLIRSDPSEIVNVYGAHRAAFVQDAGLTGRPEALIVAAFATVASRRCALRLEHRLQHGRINSHRIRAQLWAVRELDPALSRKI
jgi:hypothetical protein